MPWLNPALPELAELVADLLALPSVKSCSMSPSELNRLPAVWVQLGSIPLEDQTLGSTMLELRLYLIVADTDDGMRAMRGLADLLNAVTTVAEPDGDVTPTVVIMTDNTERPALMMPVNLYTTP